MTAKEQNRDTAETLNTHDSGYTNLLLRNGSRWWKRAIDVQAPYRWNLRRLNPGFTLDIGCGLGRNLINLEGKGVGIDHNPHSVEIAKSRGLLAFTPPQFQKSEFNRVERFDSLLLSHVAEHLDKDEALNLLTAHIPLLKQNGQVILICPQDYGYRTDPTHVQFLDFLKLRSLESEAGLAHVREYSFPFPRFFGHLFKYNEFVSISTKSHV